MLLPSAWNGIQHSVRRPLLAGRRMRHELFGKWLRKRAVTHAQWLENIAAHQSGKRLARDLLQQELYDLIAPAGIPESLPRNGLYPDPWRYRSSLQNLGRARQARPPGHPTEAVHVHAGRMAQ